MDMTFPFLLFFNQILTAAFKVYLLFRLPMQKWANRGDQVLPVQGTKWVVWLRLIMSSYMTILTLCLIGVLMLTYTELLPILSFNDIDSWLH